MPRHLTVGSIRRISTPLCTLQRGVRCVTPPGEAQERPQPTPIGQAFQLSTNELSSLFMEEAGTATLQVKTNCSYAASLTYPPY